MQAYDFQKVYRDIISVSVNLFRIMIPTLLVVRLAQEVGFDDLLVFLFAPLMAAMDLPASLALVLVTTLLTNPYAGLIVATSLPEVSQLTIGQTSIVALFMLFTHGLPLEAMVSSRVGVRLWFVIVLRLAVGFLSAIMLAQIFALTGWFSAPANVTLFQIMGENIVHDTSWFGWLKDQMLGLVVVQLVIIILVASLELLRIVRFEQLMTWALTPILRIMGIGNRASTIAIVGVMLGLSFGSGLLMKDVATGTIPKKDVFGVVCFINLMHSVIEDTAVVALLGPSLLVIIGFRFLISVIMTLIAMAIASQLSDAQIRRFLTNKNIPASAG